MTDQELQALVRGLAPVVRELVTAAVAPLAQRLTALEALPVPRDGRDGQPGPPGPPGTNGRDGTNGTDGQPGRDGADGLGFDDLQVLYDGERTITHRYVRGDRTKAVDVVLPVPVYRGVWQRSATYVRGDCVTFGGSLWHANETPSSAAKPGDGSSVWTLSVKRGQDGKAGA